MKTNLLLAAALVSLTTFAAEKAATPPVKRAADPAFAKVEDVAGLPRVLIIGDSISIGYTAPVRAMLAGKANVHRIDTNGGPTINGLKNLKTWLGDSKWDVIHFNWGLHDLKYIAEKGDTIADAKAPGAHMQVEIGDYEKNLAELVKKLKTTGAKLIWCNTTPVPEGAKGRVPGDEVKYNEAAARVMKAEGIPTDDLYAHAQKRIKEIQNKADVHYNGPGYKYLAEQVAAQIEAALPKK